MPETSRIEIGNGGENREVPSRIQVNKREGVSKVSVGEFADRGSVTRSGFSRTGALESAGEASRPMVLRLTEPRS